MTYFELLQSARKESPDPERHREIQSLLQWVFQISDTGFWINKDRPAGPPDALHRFQGLLRRWQQDEPLAYLTGISYFYSRPFTVNRHVLIPRPETELLVERVISCCRPEYRILELGAGSGNVAVTLARETACPVTAVEICPRALKVLQANIRRHRVASRVIPRQTDLLTGLKGNWDILVSNPPYIRSEDFDGLPPSVRNYEPRLALDGGEGGLDVIRSIIRHGRRVLKQGGKLLLEIGYDQQGPVQSLLRNCGYRDIRQHRDLNGLWRVAEARV